MARKPRINTGDVIEIPIGVNQLAYAQILYRKVLLYLTVFSRTYPSMPSSIQEIMTDKRVLCGWTMDAKIASGDWRIVGTSNVSESCMFRQEYKVEFNNNVWIEDFDGKLIRRATSEESEKLRLRSSYTPALLEQVIRAYHGMEPWCQEFDDLLSCAS